MEKKTFTKKQFAVALEVSEGLVNKWIRTGKVRVIYLGRCVRIPADELERVLAGGVR
jgi:excisionase family DNA binding protein